MVFPRTAPDSWAAGDTMIYRHINFAGLSMKSRQNFIRDVFFPQTTRRFALFARVLSSPSPTHSRPDHFNASYNPVKTSPAHHAATYETQHRENRPERPRKDVKVLQRSIHLANAKMHNIDAGYALFTFTDSPSFRRTPPTRHLNWQRVPIPDCISIRPIVARLHDLRIEIEEQEELNAAGQTLLERWGFSRSTPISDHPYSELASFDSYVFLNILLSSDTIGTVRKESVFSEEVTENEMDIIQKRVALQQRQFAEYERREKLRKSRKICAMFDYVCEEEIDEMLLDCEGDEEEVVVRLTQPGYLYGIRKIIATKYTTEIESHEDDDGSGQKYRSYPYHYLPKSCHSNARQYRMGGRLALDDALKQVQEHKIDPAKAFEGWSQARIRAYQMIDQNPNSYYYRFNAPGEVQRKGQWTEVGGGEEALSQKAGRGWRERAMGVIFNVNPGTSGIPGKAHYLFDKKNSKGEVEKTFRTHSKHTTTTTERPPRSRSAAGGGSSASTSSRKRKRRNNRWGGSDDDDDLAGYDDDDSGSFTMKSWSTTKRTRARMAAAVDAASSETGEASGAGEGGSEEVDEEEKERMMNPLPGFLDPITLDEVVKPAISKYGHVIGYSKLTNLCYGHVARSRYESWVRCLTNWDGNKNICPLTKKPLTKRDLVILTHENIDEYRDKIVNL
ncbi:hypothetical protein BC937DRAFT_86241 [Endogone sp. FLAS-F59071]|nr:hypothetical protein BC937DRAFT_86241 [Endogone sp. FLAS-F59071]|eukprot:RUS20171.1 hypothetical protein BC937DRAFT_86241 [Endogone sp. FLAS-F59071]